MASHGDPATRKELLITNARVIDGNGSPPPKRLSAIRIEDGRIAEIADDPTGGAAATGQTAAPGTRVLDAAGATVMPGLIDAHVHLQSVPGSAQRRDSEERLAELRFHHLKAYLACGVTTVLDNGISAEWLRTFQDHLAAGGVGPRIRAVVPQFFPPSGYLDGGLLSPQWGPMWGPVDSRADVESLFAEYDGLEQCIVGAKVLMEPGVSWPIHSPEMREIIVQEAAKRNLPIYVHATKQKEQEIALDMGAYNLAHSGFYTGPPPSTEFLGRMRAQGTYLTTTLASTIEQLLIQYQPERLDDPLMKLVVPRELLATAADPEAWPQMYVQLMRGFAPSWVPPMVFTGYRKLLNVLSLEKFMERTVRRASSAVKQMHEAGIPIVLGTDSANFPTFISFFHGPSTIRETELLREAGMPAMDVLCSATRIPAEMMGIDHLVGTVEVGKRADLIVVGEDPLTNPMALRRSLRYTIRDGDARTPQEWMQVNDRPTTQIRRKSTTTGEGTWQGTEAQEEAYSSPTHAS
jgi:imidazolonepropionase-like amidohydrolase